MASDGLFCDCILCYVHRSRGLLPGNSHMTIINMPHLTARLLNTQAAAHDAKQSLIHPQPDQQYRTHAVGSQKSLLVNDVHQVPTVLQQTEHAAKGLAF